MPRPARVPIAAAIGMTVSGGQFPVYRGLLREVAECPRRKRPADTPGARRRSFLDVVERIGNALPDPTTLFALLALFVVLMSGSRTVRPLRRHPTTGKLIEPLSLLSWPDCTGS